MKFSCGIEAHDTIKGSWGEYGYLMWVEDSYFPRVFYVRGDNWCDAEEWALEDEHFIVHIRIDDPKAEFGTVEEYSKALDSGVIGISPSGVTYWAEGINGRQIHGTPV